MGGESMVVSGSGNWSVCGHKCCVILVAGVTRWHCLVDKYVLPNTLITYGLRYL